MTEMRKANIWRRIMREEGWAGEWSDIFLVIVVGPPDRLVGENVMQKARLAFINERICGKW